MCVMVACTLICFALELGDSHVWWTLMAGSGWARIGSCLTLAGQDQVGACAKGPLHAGAHRSPAYQA